MLQYQRTTMLDDLRAAIAAGQESSSSPEAVVQSMREALDRRARCHHEFIEHFAEDYLGTDTPERCLELRGRIDALNEAVLLAAGCIVGGYSRASLELLDRMLMALFGATLQYEEDIEMCATMAAARSGRLPLPPPLEITWKAPPGKRHYYS